MQKPQNILLACKSFALSANLSIQKALKQPIDQNMILQSVSNEAICFFVFLIDLFLFQKKVNNNIRKYIIDEIVNDNSNSPQNSQKINALLNKRLKEYSKYSNDIKVFIEIYIQVLIKSYRDNDNFEYIHGETALETDLLLIMDINHSITTITELLINDIDKIIINDLSLINSDKESVESSWINIFCHQVLPSFIFKSELLERFFSNPSSVFTDLYNLFIDKYEVKEQIKIATSIHDILKGKLLIAYFPKPQRPLEPLYIGLLFQYKKGLFKNTAVSIQYFTYENSFDFEKNEQCYQFCYYQNPARHITLSRSNDYSVNTFINFIESR